jgi:hypothetical protein
MVATGAVGSGLAGAQVEVGSGEGGENVASVAGAGIGSESEGVAGIVTMFSEVKTEGTGAGDDVTSGGEAAVGSSGEGVTGAVTLFLATVITVHPNARVESSHIRLSGFGVSIANYLTLVRLDVMSGSC